MDKDILVHRGYLSGATWDSTMIYMATGFAYLSWIDFVKADGATETARIADDEERGYLRLGAIHFTLFALVVSEWASSSE